MLRAGDRDTFEVDLVRVLRLSEVIAWDPASGGEAVPSPSERPSNCAVKASSTSTSSSGRLGSDACMSSDLWAAVSCIRESISGLCLARLECVGEAKEGRLVDRVGVDWGSSCCCAACGGGPEGVVEPTSTEAVGDVFRLFGAEDSIVGK